METPTWSWPTRRPSKQDWIWLRARADIAAPAMYAVLQQGVQDLTTLKVEKAPTFFVNGRPLPNFGQKQLADLVAQEVSKLKR